MPEVTFTQEDIVSAVAMDASWQPMQMKEISEGPGSKDPSSTTWKLDFEILDGPYKGAIVTTYFSSKMMKNVIQYMRCFTQVAAGQTYPLESTKSRPVMGFVQYDVSFNNNKIVAFKQMGK